MEMKPKRDKNAGIELLRIIAAFMVVGVHVNHGMYYFEGLSRTGILISCFVADGVAIFWMIMGFFLFDSEYGKVLKRSVRHVLIPMILYTLLMFFFSAFLNGETDDIFFGFKVPFESYRNLITEGLLKWKNIVANCGQFWYLYCYMVVVFFYPALKGIVDQAGKKNLLSGRRGLKDGRKELQSEKKETQSGKETSGDYESLIGLRLLFLIAFGLLIINDKTLNGLFRFSHDAFPGAFGASFIIILGHIIYRHKHLFENKRLAGLLGLVSFVMINLIRMLVQYRILVKEIGGNHVLYWYTGFAVLSTYSLIIFSFGFQDLLNRGILKKLILHVAGLTMGIYFVHPMVIARLRVMGIMDHIESRLVNSTASIVKLQLEKMLIVFLISAVIVEIFMLLRRLIKGREKWFLLIALILLSGEAVRLNILSSKIEKQWPDIVCWGDSLTYGFGGEGTDYPGVLKTLIEDDIYKDVLKFERSFINEPDVINYGVEAENAPAIVCRSGAMAFVLSEALEVPGDSSPAEIKIMAEDGHMVNPLRRYPGNMWTVRLESPDGSSVHGTFSIRQESPSSPEYSYFFQRDEEEELAAVSFPAGSRLIPDLYQESSGYKDYFPVIFIGQNGGWDSPEDLIEQQRKIIASYGDGEHFVIVGLQTGSLESRKELEEAMEKEYGERYINLREYLCNEALEKTDAVLSDEDRSRVEQGIVPGCFMYDSIHLNAEGYTLLAEEVYKAVKEQIN